MATDYAGKALGMLERKALSTRDVAAGLRRSNIFARNLLRELSSAGQVEYDTKRFVWKKVTQEAV